MLICCVYGISFKENFLEDGHNRWTKHTVSYVFYNTVNLHTCVCMALGSTQPLTEMSTRAFPGGKGGRCVRLTTLPPCCAVVMKSGNLNFLEPSGPVQACNGTDLPFAVVCTCWSLFLIINHQCTVMVHLKYTKFIFT